jgi:hypothetical protein
LLTDELIEAQMQRRRVVVAVGISLAIFAVVRGALAFRRFAVVERNFDMIHERDSRSFVVIKLGLPNYHAGRCGVIENSLPSCATEYVYSHPFAPLVPDYYIVAFSADDRVIAAERWSSP